MEIQTQKKENHSYFLIFLAIILPLTYDTLSKYLIETMNLASISVTNSFEIANILSKSFISILPMATLFLVAKNSENIKKSISYIEGSFLLQLIMSLLIMIFFFIFTPYLLEYGKIKPEDINTSIMYAKLNTMVFPIQSLWIIILVGMKSLGKSAYAFSISFIYVSLKFFIDLLLISDFSFAFNLGLRGIALSGLSVNTMILFISLILFLILVKKSTSPNIRITKNVYKEILNIGKWCFLNSLVLYTSYSLWTYTLLNLISTNSNNILFTESLILFFSRIILIPIIVFSEIAAIKIALSQNYKNITPIRDLIFKYSKNALMYMSLVVLISYFIAENIYALLGAPNDLLMAVKSNKNLLILVATGFIFISISQIIKSYFIGTGKTKYLFIISFFVNFLIYIPIGILAIFEVINVSLTSICSIFLITEIYGFIVTMIIYNKVITDIEVAEINRIFKPRRIKNNKYTASSHSGSIKTIQTKIEEGNLNFDLESFNIEETNNFFNNISKPSLIDEKNKEIFEK